MKKHKITTSQLAKLRSIEPTMDQSSDFSDATFIMKLLSSAERKQWAQSFTEQQYEAGEILFQEGQSGDIMHMILAGKVAIVKGNMDAPTILSYRGAGEIIGEMALLENQPRSATVVALDNLHVLSINRQKFQELLHEMPSVSLTLMETLSSRLRKTDEARSSSDQSEKRLISQVSELRTEKKRLEELRRLQQETSELIIHDLRNPLNAIAISLKMLSMTLPEPCVNANKQLLQIAQSSCDRMQRLVDSLLEVSRIESGEAEFYMTDVNLGALVAEVCQQVSVIDLKSIHIQTQISADLPHITADQDKLERVLTNLIDNALKYTPEGGSIILKAQPSAEGVQVSVTDTGPGIPVEERRRIFRRFAQSARDSRKRRGFGLGLTYCRLAVERHGGKIWVESGEAGVGSRFIFTLPLQPQESS